MQDNHIIYIIGFMGCGKSTAGKKLASVLGWSFIDLDKRVEEIAGKTIPELFSEHGEEYFRKAEADVLRSLKSEVDTVISTGGGTACYGDNMDYMLETGLTVYLKLTPAQLKSRLSESKHDRPLIKNLGKDELLDFIEKKLTAREKWYQLAEISIEGIDLDINRLQSLVNSRLAF